MPAHTIRRRWRGSSVLAGLLLAAPAVSTRAVPPPPNLPDVVAQLLPTVVAVSASWMDGRTDGSSGTPPKLHHELGSGFVIDPEGYIVTNKHVVDKATDLEVRLPDGSHLKAALVGRSEKTDIALLRVQPERPLSSARFGDSDRLRVGEAVIAIGNPLGFDNSVSAGIVSALNRNIMESPFDDYIQTDAAINHGNSGGPLFNMQGRVVGMNSVIFAPGTYGGSIGLGFSIPSNDVQFVVNQIRRYGYVRAGTFAMQFQDLNDRLRESLGLPSGIGGAIVVEVAPGGPASQADIQLGDVVLRVGGRRITDARALARAIAVSRVGFKTEVEVWRSNAIVRTEVVAALAPDAAPSGVAGPAFPQAAADRMAKRLGLTLVPADEAEPSTSSASASARTSPNQGSPPSHSGARVVAVVPSSAAAEAGLAPGDVILMTDRGPVSDPRDLMRALQESRMAGRPFTPLLVRDKDNNVRWLALSSDVKGQ
jgi:serine protease Do